MKKIIPIILFLMCAKTYAGININASVDKNRIAFGESVSLTVNVSGDISGLPKPALPAFPDFDVYSSGTSQNISFVNGKVSSSITHNFVLSPRKTGKFTISGITLSVGGKTYSTTPINIEVIPAGSSQSVPAQQKQSMGSAPETDDRGMFITAELDKRNVYVNEGVTYTFRFFSSRRMVAAPQYMPPNFTGFVTEDLPPQKNYQTQINGKVYNVIEIRTKLFPVTQGVYELGYASLRVRVQDFGGSPFGSIFDDDFFGNFFGASQEIVLKSKPIQVKVMPLPESAKPAGFSGTVGSFNVNASVDKNTVEQNSPVTLSVAVSGSGNIKSISAPNLPDMPGVKKYETISSLNIAKSESNVSGSKTFKTVIIPERVGVLKIPQVEYIFFDPGKREYVAKKTQALSIKVVPSMDVISGGGHISGKASVSERDIRFIKTDIGKQNDSRLWNIASLLLLGLSAALLLSSVVYRNVILGNIKGIWFFGKRKALKKFLKKIGNLNSEQIPLKEYYGLIVEYLMEYLSSKTGCQLTGFTLNEIENILLEKNLPEEYVIKIRNFLEEADLIRFTPDSASHGEKYLSSNPSENLCALIKKADKVWKK